MRHTVPIQRKQTTGGRRGAECPESRGTVPTALIMRTTEQARDAALRLDPGNERGEDALPGHIAALSRSEEHTSELQSLMRISYAVFCLKKKTLLDITTNKHECYLTISS